MDKMPALEDVSQVHPPHGADNLARTRSLVLPPPPEETSVEFRSVPNLSSSALFKQEETQSSPGMRKKRSSLKDATQPKSGYGKSRTFLSDASQPNPGSRKTRSMNIENTTSADMLIDEADIKFPSPDKLMRDAPGSANLKTTTGADMIVDGAAAKSGATSTGTETVFSAKLMQDESDDSDPEKVNELFNAVVLQNQPLDGGEEDVNAPLLLGQPENGNVGDDANAPPFQNLPPDGGHEDVNAPPDLGQPENGNVGDDANAPPFQNLPPDGGQEDVNAPPDLGQPENGNVDDGDDVNALLLLDQLFPPHQDPLDRDPLEDDIDDGDDVNAPPVLGQPENGNVGAPLDRAVRLRDLEFANGGHQMIEPAAIFHAHLDPLEDDIDDGDDVNAPPVCGICLEEFDEDEGIILKSCSHVFCKNCIQQVLSRSSKRCPYCRHAFCQADIVDMSTARSAAMKKWQRRCSSGPSGPT
eukprot:scaffold1288_cov84-Cylindrotheca_fusiformis.AAC.3